MFMKSNKDLCELFLFVIWIMKLYKSFLFIKKQFLKSSKITSCIINFFHNSTEFSSNLYLQTWLEFLSLPTRLHKNDIATPKVFRIERFTLYFCYLHWPEYSIVFLVNDTSFILLFPFSSIRWNHLKNFQLFQCWFFWYSSAILL